MLDLNLLRALDALLDERNVTRAAQRLSLTQPAVSAMLTRLRESFDDPLFVRSQRGIVPTERALQLAAPLKQVLSDIEQMLQAPAFEPREAELTLTIASTDYALRAVVVPFLARLRQEAPGIRAVIVPVQHERLQAQLESGDVDMALITPETTPADLHARRLFDERYVCVMRADHPAAARRLTLERFCALDHALVSYAGGSLSGVTDEALARIGRARRVTVSVNSFLVLPDILLTSDLIAVVPSRLAQGVQGLAVVEPPLEVPGFTKTLAWHERSHRAPGQRWVRALLFGTCEGLGAEAEV
ncbi:LysR family transcriptional regulator [Paraburkholderia unamae]|uniref:LysR family transcriptional regulator n=1 Tax=Paraburkholderia unamae TaxID=219649 RepID=A0ABX5KAW1_9BURK|nr:LysR family transcriptional regulator [Paraburkholderia unamae]PVX61332.1 LysR family transcriptional regulator [Paraburkholderia unamae]